MEDMYGHAKSRNDTCTSVSEYTISATDCVCLCVLQMMTKVVAREWKHYAEETSKDLAAITASKRRKVAVTSIRESGADSSRQY